MRRRPAAPIGLDGGGIEMSVPPTRAHRHDLAVRLEAPHLIDRALQDDGDLARDQVTLPLTLPADALRVTDRADGGFSPSTVAPPPRVVVRRVSRTAARRVALARNLPCGPEAHAERTRGRSARAPHVSGLKDVGRCERTGRCAPCRLPPPQATTAIFAAGMARCRYSMGRPAGRRRQPGPRPSPRRGPGSRRLSDVLPCRWTPRGPRAPTGVATVPSYVRCTVAPRHLRSWTRDVRGTARLRRQWCARRCRRDPPRGSS